jgi:4'-phosphopantetheinyl transferase
VARVARSVGCQVWWAHIGCLRPEHEGLIDLHQARRLRRLVRAEDRARLVVAAALARSVIGRELSCSPKTVRFDRTCSTCGGPHGKPAVVDGDGLELSVSHSGSWVVVAVARQPVGVDVEDRRPGMDLSALVGHVLTPSEQRVLQGVPAAAHEEAFLRYWTRKESILKATGDGLRVPMDALTVSAPAEPAALRHWRHRPDMSSRVALLDMNSPQGDPAAVAVLNRPAVEVREFDGRSLLTEVFTPASPTG